MATNLAVTIAVIFLSLTLVNGRAPLSLPEAEKKGVPSHSILLPSQKPESEKQTESKLPEIEPKTTESTTEEKHVAETHTTVPLTVITFRPINRQFIRGSSIPFRRGHRCSHHHNHHHQQFKRWGPRFHGREISFGNDMITGSHPVTGGKNHRIPARWSRFHHEHHPKFSFMPAKEKMEDMKMPHREHHHHHYHHHHHKDRQFEHEHEHKHEYGMGIFRQIRKFLTRF